MNPVKFVILLLSSVFRPERRSFHHGRSCIFPFRPWRRTNSPETLTSRGGDLLEGKWRDTHHPAGCHSISCDGVNSPCQSLKKWKKNMYWVYVSDARTASHMYVHTNIIHLVFWYEGLVVALCESPSYVLNSLWAHKRSNSLPLKSSSW